MNALTNSVARALYALPFGVFGILHFINANAMAGYVPIPGGALWVYLTGLAFLAACVSILIEKKTFLAGLLLGILLLIFVVTIHIPAIINAADAMAMQNSLTQLLKDTALAGGALYIAGRYRDVAPGRSEAPRTGESPHTRETPGPGEAPPSDTGPAY